MKRRSWKKLILYAIAGVWLLATIIPLLYVFISSFKTNDEMYRSALNLPTHWKIENYVVANELGHSFRSIGNSLLVALSTTVIEVIVAMMAAYAISRKRHIFFARHAYMLFVVGVMVPIHSTLIPISSMAASWGLKNNFAYLVLVYVCFNLAQGIFLFTGFLDSVSREIDEAAIIDGCSDFRLLRSVLLPICKPIIATEAIFSFIYAYGELVFSLTLISDPAKYTVPRAMLSFWGEFSAQMGPQYAFIILSVIPVIIIYVLFHNQIQSGVMSGAVKG
ncbi:carbohydrate ABC transporter permease [Eubacterium sp. am_0171]|uniref:Inner membrane ABC transporter permease protein ycjP n=1 Tax=Faecalicatena contorta TaxID=39482 RepID=A0A174EPU4_9FIRM|nr:MULTISPECIES: carbohydrate ABC transporter permease [Clostridia]MSC82359.1 ABC transporter permease subunit [Eubacterium sp. BIOML-A1]MSD04729.1 ABC transporter permease subunit [Eubacterium sp. BIOML-A2]RYT25661.1 carbohydrate ABC transporter permease [Eubacterium sp. am_0171]CUO39501.1 Inner membrane ABC transporter permease protein ycjP [[Eubacterium] contortum] [Faecalicatena contorta]